MVKKKSLDEQIKVLDEKKQQLVLLKEKSVSKGLKYVIVRTYSAGVFAGFLHSRVGKEVVLKSARRLWYWEGAASLSQLAVDGVSKPDKCKFPVVVPEVVLTEAIEILKVSVKAKASIEGVFVWQNTDRGFNNGERSYLNTINKRIEAYNETNAPQKKNKDIRVSEKVFEIFQEVMK